MSRQLIQGAMCDGDAKTLSQPAYQKQMKDAAFRVCSGKAATEGRIYTEPATFPANSTQLTEEQKRMLPCLNVPPSETIVAETIAMGKCPGACDVASRAEEDSCAVQGFRNVPSGWTADNFQPTQNQTCGNACVCANGVLKCEAVPCKASLHDRFAIRFDALQMNREQRSLQQNQLDDRLAD
jgi:hypothetical protein